MNELFVMFLIYVVSIFITAFLWFFLVKKNEQGDLKFMFGFLLTGPVAFIMTLWELGSLHFARKRGDFL